MNEIHNIGNLPIHLRLFAKEVGGTYSSVTTTKFFEMSNITEFENKASEIGYEILPTLDQSTNRGFLIGFDAEDTRIAGPGGEYYSRLIIYFIEITADELKQWDKKIKQHKQDQQEDMRDRQIINEKARKKRSKYLKKGKK